MTDYRSAEATAYRKLYKTARYRRLRHAHASANPLCRFCLITEDISPVDVVDHVKPHKGDLDLFFDPDNLQSLCKHHHDSAKQMIEAGKNVVTYGLDGYPIELG